MLGAIIRGFTWAMSFLFTTKIGQVLTALGIGVATYEGIDTALNAGHSMISSQIASTGGAVSEVLFTINADKAVSMIFGAMAGRAGLAAGKRLVFRPT